MAYQMTPFINELPKITVPLGLKLTGVAGVFIFPLLVAFLKNLHDAGVINVSKPNELGK